MFSLLYGKTAAALFAKAAELQHEVGRVSFPSARDGLCASPGMFLQRHPCPLTMRENLVVRRHAATRLVARTAPD